MSPGVTFRCTCENCGTVFFGPQRGATACPKCAKRYRLREAPPKAAAKTGDDMFAPARPTAPPRSRPADRHKAPAHPIAPRRPRITTLDEELRNAILQAYAAFEGKDVPLRILHAEIAARTNTTRALVAQVINAANSAAMALTPEQRERVIVRYQEFVTHMIRPHGGRRSTIARELGLSRQQVILTVREWTEGQPAVRDLSRADLLRIERAYWDVLASATSFEGLAARLAAALGYTEWQVSRWLDLIHDGDFSTVTAPTAEQSAAVIAAYQEYLQVVAPPEQSLHVLLGERFSLDPKQVHKVLLEYRLETRRRAFGF